MQEALARRDGPAAPLLTCEEGDRGAMVSTCMLDGSAARLLTDGLGSVSSGLIRAHQGSSGLIRAHQGSSGLIRAHQGSSGLIRAHQVTNGLGSVGGRGRGVALGGAVLARLRRDEAKQGLCSLRAALEHIACLGRDGREALRWRTGHRHVPKRWRHRRINRGDDAMVSVFQVDAPVQQDAQHAALGSITRSLERRSGRHLSHARGGVGSGSGVRSGWVRLGGKDGGGVW